MQLVLLVFTIILIVGVIVSFTRYEPKLDLVKSKNKYIMLLWYNKYNWTGEYIKRAYIKLFEV